MKTKFFLIIFLTIILFGFSYNDENEANVIIKDDLIYSSNEIIVKFKANYDSDVNRFNFLSLIMKISNQISISSIEPIFNIPNDKTIIAKFGLDRIYSLKYSGKFDPLLLAKKLNQLYEIEYAEPRYIYKINFTPNDPLISSQTYLNRVKAFDAWDVSRGDTNVVIGIIDTGVYWFHPDLEANIWINRNEIPNNGIDDDNNGYIDDIRGWDFGGLNGTPDNDPREDAPDHGTHVAGIASAVTNNGIGVAGMGFKCKILAVKTSRNDRRDPNTNSPYIWYGYEGIVYAADNGAQIINCSWGGSGFSQYGQDIINYATAKGSLVIAAAGNSGINADFFPASYKNVFSVAALTTNDYKASFSNYGYNIDGSAPGTSIYNTWSTNTYAFLSGTSMAAPIVAGIAGLVKSRYFNYTPEQIGEKIRISCDDINNINPSFQYMLGKGKVNAWKALQDTINTSVRMLSYIFDDSPPLGNGNQVLEPNEIANIKVSFKNILSSTNQLTISLSSLTPGIAVINGTFNAHSKASGEIFNNHNSPFRIQASSTITRDVVVRLLLNYNDGSYSDWQIIHFIANPSYAVVNNSNISITIGSKGNLAFNDFPNNTHGRGFRYKSSNNLLFEGALIIGTSSVKISDVARNQTGNTQNQDFSIITPIKIFLPGSTSDIETQSIFNDDGAGINKIGVRVVLNSYMYSNQTNSDFVILHYKFINTNSYTLTNFHAGLFFDWDLIDGSGLDDVCLWDNINKFGYIFHQPQVVPYYVGTALISHSNHHFRAILNPGGDGGWGIYDGFTDEEKWQSISGGISKTQAGAGDVSYVVAGGPFSINPGDTLNIAFAIAAGDNLSHLQTNINLAKQKWNQVITNVHNNNLISFNYQLNQNFPNPFNSKTRINYSIEKDGFVTLKIFDLKGSHIATLVNENKNRGLHQIEFDANKFGLSSGIYFYELKVNDFSARRKFVYIK